MLLRNESRIKHTIEIKLVFDDNRTREIEINVCDQVQMSYKKNGCLKQAVGVIRDIKPYVHTKRYPFCKRESAIITLDMSEDYVCCSDKIDLYDIIDIRKLNDGCCCESKTEEPDFTVRSPKCRVGYPVTNKEVVVRG